VPGCSVPRLDGGYYEKISPLPTGHHSPERSRPCCTPKFGRCGTSGPVYLGLVSSSAF
jgi:hypothetical protein